MTIHAKYHPNLTSGFGEEDFQRFSFRLPWQPEFCMEWNSFNNFCRGPSQEHPCEVLSKLT